MSGRGPWRPRVGVAVGAGVGVAVGGGGSSHSSVNGFQSQRGLGSSDSSWPSTAADTPIDTMPYPTSSLPPKDCITEYLHPKPRRSAETTYAELLPSSIASGRALVQPPNSRTHPAPGGCAERLTRRSSYAAYLTRHSPLSNRVHGG